MSRDRDLLLIKLGGSVITHKGRPRTVRRQRLGRIAGELAAALATTGAGAIVGHGSGSFGHVVAARYGVHRGIQGARGAMAAARTQSEAAQLHRTVVEALIGAGLPAWSVSPSSTMVTDAGAVRSFAVEPVGLALDAGMLPVTHGDVVVDGVRGAAICSTENALLAIARGLIAGGVTPSRALWFGDTDGVWDAGGQRLERVSLSDRDGLLAEVGGASVTDVTGGMHHRLEAAFALAELGIESWVLDGRAQGAVAAAVRGEPTGGTRVCR